MPIAGGLVEVRSNRLTGTFNIDNQVFYFSASVGGDMPPARSNSATLSYNDLGDLVASNSFSGTIGPQFLDITVGGNVTIKGNLDIPGLPSSVSVDGRGTWQNH
jgi:hypothetical protein